MRKTIIYLVLIFIVFAAGFFVGRYKYMANDITFRRIPPLKIDMKVFDEFPEEGREKLFGAIKDLEAITGKPLDLEEYHPFSRRVDFGGLVVAANDDFSQYAFGTKNESGDVYWVAAQHADEDGFRNEYYGPNARASGGDFLPVETPLYTLMRGRKPGDSVATFCHFGDIIEPHNWYIDKESDGLWDQWMQCDVPGSKTVYYSRDGLQWVERPSSEDTPPEESEQEPQPGT